MAAEIEGMGGESALFEVIEEVFIPAPRGMPHAMDKKNWRRRVEATPGLSTNHLDIVHLHLGR